MVFGPMQSAAMLGSRATGLNALTGIDGFWTKKEIKMDENLMAQVLTPLRALMVFGLIVDVPGGRSIVKGLNALTGIDGFWTHWKEIVSRYPHGKKS